MILFVRGEGTDDNDVLRPNYLRNSIVRFPSNLKAPKFARAFTFQAFHFLFLGLQKKAPYRELQQFIGDLKAFAPDATLIAPAVNKIAIRAGLSAFDAIKGHFFCAKTITAKNIFNSSKLKWAINNRFKIALKSENQFYFR